MLRGKLRNKYGFKNGPGHEKTYLTVCANNNGADQPVHPCSLISAFVACCLDSIIHILAKVCIKFKTLACLCSWTDQLESYLDRFSHNAAQILFPGPCCKWERGGYDKFRPAPRYDRQSRQYLHILSFCAGKYQFAFKFSAPDFGSLGFGFVSRWRRDSFQT